ncbi:chaperone NapD [Variovorax ureilyticus]|uniref:Chaperone NapD n=1 Tax=Variovorax ureilyticus TaxID=1836198 RepID=A0ABU8VHK1_9BURK
MSVARRPIPIEPERHADEWHIAGVVVHADPARLGEVRAAIDAMAGAEIHAGNDAGKLVVTLEAPTMRAIAAHLEYLHRLDGVLSAALVYQHNEDADSMEEEMTDDHAP